MNFNLYVVDWDIGFCRKIWLFELWFTLIFDFSQSNIQFLHSAFCCLQLNDYEFHSFIPSFYSLNSLFPLPFFNILFTGRMKETQSYHLLVAQNFVPLLSTSIGFLPNYCSPSILNFFLLFSSFPQFLLLHKELHNRFIHRYFQRSSFEVYW